MIEWRFFQSQDRHIKPSEVDTESEEGALNNPTF